MVAFLLFNVTQHTKRFWHTESISDESGVWVCGHARKHLAWPYKMILLIFLFRETMGGLPLFVQRKPAGPYILYQRAVWRYCLQNCNSRNFNEIQIMNPAAASYRHSSRFTAILLVFLDECTVHRQMFRWSMLVRVLGLKQQSFEVLLLSMTTQTCHRNHRNFMS